MSISDNQVFESFLPVYDAVPESWADARPFLVEQLKRIAIAVNTREIGWFLDEEVLSGKAFIPGANALSSGATSNIYRQVLRKIIDFGALPAAGTKSVAHGITVDANFTLTFLGAYATNPTALNALAIPHASASAIANQIRIDIDATNVNIAVGSNRSAYTRCYVTIEYMQEL